MYRIMAVTRARYQEMLYAAAVERGVDVRFGCRVVGVEEEGKQGVVVRLSTGERIRADVVVGADGKMLLTPYLPSHPITRNMKSDLTHRYQIPRPRSSTGRE